MFKEISKLDDVLIVQVVDRGDVNRIFFLRNLLVNLIFMIPVQIYYSVMKGTICS